jgi:hypothetical protein
MSQAIAPIPFERLPPMLRERLAARVERLGYFGAFFQYAAHQPEALAAFIDFTEAAKSGLPERLVEVVALTCAGWSGNDYERNQHERLCVRKGLGRDWVEGVNAMAPERETRLSDVERQLQSFVLAALESRGKASAAILPALIETIGVDQAVAVLMVIGRYVVHGIFVNSLALEPPVPSIFEDGFTGEARRRPPAGE